MPGSVRRSDSQRSDSSTDSRKKVSFNKAVKVKKYSRPAKYSQTGTESPEKKFWFKVYKNRHNQEPDLVKESREYHNTDHTLNSLHPSQMPPETPTVKKDHVKHIVNIFNQESSIKPPKQSNGQYKPREPPADYEQKSPKTKKNPLVNGVRVMFGMNSLKKKKDNVQKKNLINTKKNQGTNYKQFKENKGPHTTNIIIPDNKDLSVSPSYHRRHQYTSYHPDPTAESWDSGNRLVFDTHQLDTSIEDTSEGKFSTTKEEKHQVWKKDKITKYDQPIYIERKKIYPDDRFEKLENKNKTSQYNSRSSEAIKKKNRKEDKAIQCDEFWDDSDSWDSDQSSDQDSYRVIRSKNGFVSAFSDVPSLDSYEKKDVIYSQVDKSKKTKNRPPLAAPDDLSEESKLKENSYYQHTKESQVKTTKRSFGLKLRNGFQDNIYETSTEKDWYNVDGELEEAERKRSEEELSETAPSSVIREVDYKKREISYENVPRNDGSRNDQLTRDRDPWFHKIGDDYRRDMIFNEGTMEPAYSTLGKTGKAHKTDDLSSGRSRTLDKRHFNNVKILVNGKEINETSEKDQKCVRGGLAASYQARQKAAVQRSNSSAARVFNYNSKPRLSPARGGSSAASGISSSGSESSRRRKPVILYIPGVGHPDRSIDEDDRSSGINVARTQSMLSSSKPAKYRWKNKNSRHSGSDKSDLSRSNSIPKDAKFPWFKWKVRAKPSREP